MAPLGRSDGRAAHNSCVESLGPVEAQICQQSLDPGNEVHGKQGIDAAPGHVAGESHVAAEVDVTADCQMVAKVAGSRNAEVGRRRNTLLEALAAGASIATWNAGGGGDDGDDVVAAVAVAAVVAAVAGHVETGRVVIAVVVSKVQTED